MAKQPLPAHYQCISETELPAELFPAMHVVEYSLPGASQAPVCLVVLDLCMAPEDMAQMKVSEAGVGDQQVMLVRRPSCSCVSHWTNTTPLLTPPVLQLSVEQAIALLPESTLVGVVTFGAAVYVHEMLAADIPRCVMFRGSQEATKASLVAALSSGGARAGAASPLSAFLLPLAECSFAIESVLESMRAELPLPVRRLRLRAHRTSLPPR